MKKNKIYQSEGVVGGPSGLLNPCARLLVGLAHPKVSSFLRTGVCSSAREIGLGTTFGGGPGLGSEWAQGGLGGLGVGLDGLWAGFSWSWWASGEL